jgi:hypothetical protein
VRFGTIEGERDRPVDPDKVSVWTLTRPDRSKSGFLYRKTLLFPLSERTSPQVPRSSANDLCGTHPDAASKPVPKQFSEGKKR